MVDVRTLLQQQRKERSAHSKEQPFEHYKISDLFNPEYLKEHVNDPNQKLGSKRTMLNLARSGNLPKNSDYKL